jgi:long-chain acyl-CoA synthetase
VSNMRREEVKRLGERAFGAGDFLFHAYHQCEDTQKVCIDTDTPVCVPSGARVSSFTWASLMQACRQLAGWYVALGVGIGGRVALYMDDGLAYLLHQVALNSLGAVAVYANGALSIEAASDYFKRMQVLGVITSSRQRDALLLQEHADWCFIQNHHDIIHTDESLLPDPYPYCHQDDEVVLISHTSGTTGAIKGVVQKHAHLAYGIHQFLQQRPDFSIQPTFNGDHGYLSLLPTAHNSFLAYSMRALLTNTRMTVVCDLRPESIAHQVRKHQPSVVVGFFIAYQNLVNASVDAECFASVGYWINTGDAAHQPYIKQVTAWGHHCADEKMISGSIFLDGLGSSEMGSTFFRLAHSQKTRHPLRCVGPVRDGFYAAILCEDGTSLGDYEVGQLGVKGPSVTTEYHGEVSRTANAQVNGYWLTGDLAYRDCQRRFIHVDRIPDAIDTAFGRVYSLLTEEIIFSVLPGLLECSVFPRTQNGVTVAVAALVYLEECRESQTELLQKINGALQSYQQPPISAVKNVSHDDVLRGVTGKVLKRKLAESLTE